MRTPPPHVVRMAWGLSSRVAGKGAVLEHATIRPAAPARVVQDMTRGQGEPGQASISGEKHTPRGNKSLDSGGLRAVDAPNVQRLVHGHRVVSPIRHHDLVTRDGGIHSVLDVCGGD